MESLHDFLQRLKAKDAAQKKTLPSVDESEKKVTKEKKRVIAAPPNCYVDGKIKANFGVFTYEQIYWYTKCPLDIKSGGSDRVPCSKCEIHQRYSAREIDYKYKKLVCANCHSTYIKFCNSAALDIRGGLVKKGLECLLNAINLGYDAEKQALIFPLNDYQYIELGFNGREYTQPRAEYMKVLMHYNLALVQDGKGGFEVPYNFGWSEYQYMPYLDNRFFGLNGEEVIAGRACSIDEKGNLDNGKNYCEKGKMILPFPI